MDALNESVGTHLRAWRKRRRMSQLDLACEAEISSKHLSFVETGRAKPSRDMVLRLCDCLTVPPREQNVVLLAAGYAPHFPSRPIDDPALESARKAVDLVLSGYEPFPALAVDRHWNLVTANRMFPLFMDGVDMTLLAPPINVLRLTLHPSGLAPKILNLRETRDHLLWRLRQQIDLSADPVLISLVEELATYPCHPSRSVRETEDYAGIALPVLFESDRGLLSFFSTTTVFGTPIDITLSELAIEAFFPADEFTASALRAMMAST